MDVAPNETGETYPKLPGGRLYSHGYYAKRLHHAKTCEDPPKRGDGPGCDPDFCELIAFKVLFSEYREKYPDLDNVHDEADLIELVVTTVMLQRSDPPPTKAELEGNEKKHGKNSFDYSVARAKLRVMIADQLGISRKQRKAQGTKQDIRDALAEFFTKDGRQRQTHGRTKSTVKVDVQEDPSGVHPEGVEP